MGCAHKINTASGNDMHHRWGNHRRWVSTPPGGCGEPQDRPCILDTFWIRFGYVLNTFWIRYQYGYVLDTLWIRSAADLDTGAKTLLTQYPKFWIRDMPRAMDQSLTDSTFASPVLGWLRAALGWPAPHWDERGTANVESLYGP